MKPLSISNFGNFKQQTLNQNTLGTKELSFKSALFNTKMTEEPVPKSGNVRYSDEPIPTEGQKLNFLA